MDTRGSHYSPALVLTMSNLENILGATHGFESYASVRNHRERAHQVIGPPEHLGHGNNGREVEVLQPVDIQRMAPPQDKLQLLLMKDFESIGAAPIKEASMKETKIR